MNGIDDLSVSDKLRLSVNIRKKTVGSKVLLRDIRAELRGGDFVLILGGSGAGKTTLVRAILGDSRAEGKILLNGRDLYSDFESLKAEIGMVPQFLTLRRSDTVRGTLSDTAAIMLGKYTRSQRRQRVDEVLTSLGISEQADCCIGQLSGGQQKKVSVANQLIGRQQVFICDEPDSGLDAASRKQQMRLLESISRTGRIVMVISHEPDDAISQLSGGLDPLYTKTVVLAKSLRDGAGHLAFFGGAHEALLFFGVKRLRDIMLELNPPSEGGHGRADEYIEKYARLRSDNNELRLLPSTDRSLLQ